MSLTTKGSFANEVNYEVEVVWEEMKTPCLHGCRNEATYNCVTVFIYKSISLECNVPMIKELSLLTTKKSFRY